ncbi:hypothetical protein BDY21DRAFT_370727 [Lineolata rhizophorae]|uniref:ZZ-type domain-containing protein n=1 Tax=Lineolata rhizophorae TaxID=578093 RepID=A0A6A6P406_9PEZI|nr:hypothetical protein BDY21DRAFT_370727 [Lineolata rhizophorae]
MASNVPVTPDTLITVKVSVGSTNRRFKIPLRDLSAQSLPPKLYVLLGIPADEHVVFERFSDSAGAYVTLDPNNPQVYKTLFRAAKAKLKLRLRAIVDGDMNEQAPSSSPPAAIGGQEMGESSKPASIPEAAASSKTASTVTLTTQPSIPNVRRSLAVEDSVQPPSYDRPDLKANWAAEKPCSFFAPGGFAHGGLTIKNILEPEQGAGTPSHFGSWSVYCNNCDRPMTDEHYHCSICDDGDYDLCRSCVDKGVHCPGEGHWLIKRFIRSGKVVNSKTEKVAPKKEEEVAAAPTAKECMPGAFADEKKAEPEADETPTRTCNSCIQVFQEHMFVTCVDCDDYDLCIPCHVERKHGHHPGHVFKPVDEAAELAPQARMLCAAGRNVRHAALCDGCDKTIYGVRHKCLNCPDWDFCSDCIKNARFTHPRHRFVPVYEPLQDAPRSYVRHFGIFCDGPHCRGKSGQEYIVGVRYKCAICHDTDFCATCEASPFNKHNRTHPLIKLQNPVRNVSVTTMGEDKNGAALSTMGDQIARRSVSTETMPAPVNSSAEVRTVADVKPTPAEEPKQQPAKEKIAIKDLLSEPVQEKPEAETEKAREILRRDLSINAHFIKDAVPDGTVVAPNQVFTQVWTLRNPGPIVWPAGCSIRYVGGDGTMLNIPPGRTASAIVVADATESNVVGRPVPAGEEVSFRVTLKAPASPGVAISYWRLKTAEGMAFGHKLWCHVVVRNPPASAAQQPRSSFSSALPIRQPVNPPLPPPPAPPMPQAPPMPRAMHQYAAEQQNAMRTMQLQTEYARRQANLQNIQQLQAQLQARARALQTGADGANQQMGELMRSALMRANNDCRTAKMRLSVHKAAMEQHLQRTRGRSGDAEEKPEEKEKIEEHMKPVKEEKTEMPEEKPEGKEINEPEAKEEINEPEAKEEIKEPEAEAKAPVKPQPVKIEDADEESRAEHIEDIAAKRSASKSPGMVFPQLDKESPVSSTHEGAAASPAEIPAPTEQVAPVAVASPAVTTTETATTTTATTTTAPAHEELLFEDAESVEILSASSADESEDGFLTDEEYDILDASDEEP